MRLTVTVLALQEHISLLLFWRRLRHVYTALTPHELVRIEKETLLLLLASDGLPCNGPYLTYAEQLWNTANFVRSPGPFHLPLQPRSSPRVHLPSLPQLMGVQPAQTEIMTPWF